MTLAEYIQIEIFLPRLKTHRVLVVYDETGRYREACEALASEQCAFIDTASRPFSSRLKAMERWREMRGDFGILGRGTKLRFVHSPALR